jgi:hypothetical protein
MMAERAMTTGRIALGMALVAGLLAVAALVLAVFY